MQFAFSGERTQDAGAFLACFEHHAISIGRITDNEKLPLLVATFYGRARDWYDSLPQNEQGEYQLLVHQFRTRYIQWKSATEVREELFQLKMESPFGFLEYERNFQELWTTWIRLRGGTEDEWFKIEQFKVGLDMHFRLEASLKDPTTFQALLQVCQDYDRQVKMMSSMGDPQMTALGANLMPRANFQALSSIVHGGQVFPNVYTTTTINPTSISQEVEQVRSEQDTMALVNRRFDEVMTHLRQSQAIHNTIPDGGGSRGHHGVICYSCQEEGHISTRCPHRQQRGMGRGIYQVQRNGQRPNNNEVEGNVTLPMAQVPTIPHNVNLLNFIDDSDNSFEVAPVKRTRSSQKEKEVEGESSASRQKKKSKENEKEEKLRRRHSRRKIKMEDIPMGEGVEAFNLKHELISSGPRITWPQLLQLSSTLQNEWGRLVSICQSQKTVHYVGIMRVEDRKDIRPIIPVSIKGVHIKDALGDSGARVSLISEFVVNKVGIPISRSSSTRVVVVDSGVVHCTSIVEDVFIKCFGIRGEACNKYHINLKESVSISPKLRQLSVEQKEEFMQEFNAWLQESSNYKMEDLRCVSPIVLVPKKNEINFKALNDSTKRDEFSLPSRDEIVDKMVVYTKQGSVDNMLCQKGFHVDDSKINIITKMTIPTSLEALKVFVQKVRSLERFIYMLTCLLLSRVMYPMALLVFGELTKT